MFKVIFILLCYFFIVIGFFEFNLWPQVIELHDSSVDLLDLVLHPHGMRFLLVSPIFIVSDSSGVHYDVIFTGIAPWMLLSTILLLLKQVLHFKKNISENQKKMLFVFFSILVIFLAFYMNGRILFALLGFSIVSYVLVCWDALGGGKKVVLIILSLFLMSVSSGTFMIGVISISLFVFYSMVKKGLKKNILVVFLFFMGLMYSLPLLEVLVMKNIDYYGGVYSMLDHGFGQVLTSFEPVVFWGVVSSFILALLIQIFLISFYKKYLVLLYILMVSVSVGVFGYSALTMALIPLFIMSGIFLLNFLKYLVSSKPRTSSVMI